MVWKGQADRQHGNQSIRTVHFTEMYPEACLCNRMPSLEYIDSMVPLFKQREKSPEIYAMCISTYQNFGCIDCQRERERDISVSELFVDNYFKKNENEFYSEVVCELVKQIHLQCHLGPHSFTHINHSSDWVELEPLKKSIDHASVY